MQEIETQFSVRRVFHIGINFHGHLQEKQVVYQSLATFRAKMNLILPVFFIHVFLQGGYISSVPVLEGAELRFASMKCHPDNSDFVSPIRFQRYFIMTMIIWINIISPLPCEVAFRYPRGWDSGIPNQVILCINKDMIATDDGEEKW